MEREGESECNTTLALAIGGGEYTPGNSRRGGAAAFDSEPPGKFHALFPLHLCAKKEEEEDREEEEELQTKRYASGGSRKSKSSLDPEEEDGGGGQDSARKKLKLTKEQVTLLDDCFGKHHTLNNMQKQDLADRLSIQPRQVEVWFQNRRARTKLKQIEVDYELVKRCCESLNDENKRLKKELQELWSEGSPAGSPLYMQQLLKATTLTICPFCERVATTGPATRAAAAASTAVESMKSSATTGVLRFKNN